MKFWRRLKIYLIGFGLGLIIVYIMFGNRDLTTWTPQQRVLGIIDSTETSISTRASCQMSCQELKEEKWKEILKEASVDFSESSTRKKPCPIYRLNATHQAKTYQLIVEVCEKENKTKLLAIQEEGRKCDCPS